MKVLLVALNSKFIHSNLAVRYLKEYTNDINYECTVKEFSINDRVENIVEHIMLEKPTIVGFSVYIWNSEFVKMVSNTIKIINPDIEIIYGGPEVSYDSREFLLNNIGEYLIEGEGEETYREFILYKLGQKNIEDIKGIYYKKILDTNGDVKVYCNEKRPLMDMSKIAFPYTDMGSLKNKIIYYEASRGCPFKCKYCLSSVEHGVRFLPIDRVLKELQYFIDHKVSMVKFVDRTFNCNSKFARAIWEFVINSDTDATFHFELSIDLLKDSEIELLKTAPKGRIQFEVGVQTTDPTVLNNINRGATFEEINARVEKVKELKNIKQHLDLIIGLPGENVETFKKSFNDVYSTHVEEIQVGFLKLLRGSAMRAESDMWGMRYSPYPPYELLSSKDVSYEEIRDLKKFEEMVDKYHNCQKYVNTIAILENAFKTPYELFEALSKYYLELGYFEKNISSKDNYKFLYDFYVNICTKDGRIIKNTLKYDYLLHNKKRGMPEFLREENDIKEEKEVKAKFIEEFSNIKVSTINMFKYSIDIKKYIHTNEVDYKDIYCIYLDDSDIIYCYINSKFETI